MVVRQVRAEVAGAGARQGGDAVPHGNVRRPAAHHTQRHRAVVTAQAKLGGTGRLDNGGGFGGGTGVERVGRAGVVTIPQRGLSGGIMRRVAKDTNLRLAGGNDGARTGGGEVVF